jgi:hypothetical protein
MALPQHKTGLSVLRSILGPGAGNEARFAKKIGRSVSWLKKASSGQIPLTEDAAIRISYETGISVPWLLSGDTSKQPVGVDGKPYTSKSYEIYYSEQMRGTDPTDADESRNELLLLINSLITTYCCARDNNMGGFFTHRLGIVADELAKEFQEMKMKDQGAYEDTRRWIAETYTELNKVAFPQAETPTQPRKKS